MSIKRTNQLAASHCPELRADLGSLAKLPELLKVLASEKEAFPFQRDLAFYLLFVMSLWPGENDRLVDAALIYAGALNYHINDPMTKRVKVSHLNMPFRKLFSKVLLKKFNAAFFDKIGGASSLLFCRSPADFHADVLTRLRDLDVIHDVIDFQVRCAVDFPQYNSTKFAFFAISRNFYDRRDYYGVKRSSKRGKNSDDIVISTNTIHAKWKKAPATVLISYVLARQLCPQRAEAGSLVWLTSLVNAGLTFLESTATILGNKISISNSSLAKWTAAFKRISPERLCPGPGSGFSEGQKARLSVIAGQYFKRQKQPTASAFKPIQSLKTKRI